MQYSTIALAGAALVATPISAQTPQKPAPCSTSEYRQFDFWVGEWNVFATGKTMQVATSRIEKLYGGCAIRENWMPNSGTAGGSLNGYDAREKLWRQTWHDGSGARVEFDGGLANANMVLTGLWRDVIAPGKDALVRMTYTPSPDGSVRQFGEQSVDFGVTWQTSFDFTYKPKGASALK